MDVNFKDCCTTVTVYSMLTINHPLVSSLYHTQMTVRYWLTHHEQALSYPLEHFIYAAHDHFSKIDYGVMINCDMQLLPIQKEQCHNPLIRPSTLIISTIVDCSALSLDPALCCSVTLLAYIR